MQINQYAFHYTFILNNFCFILKQTDQRKNEDKIKVRNGNEEIVVESLQQHRESAFIQYMRKNDDDDDDDGDANEMMMLA